MLVSRPSLRLAAFLVAATTFLLLVALIRPDNTQLSISRLAWGSSSASQTPLPGSVLDAFFPPGDMTFSDWWPNENNKQLRALLHCTVAGTCAQNQTKVVILASYHFADALQGGVAGENVWANSIMDALTTLGYTFLIAENVNHIGSLYRLFPSLVTVVIMESFFIPDCQASEECLQSEVNPLGVPLWKVLGFEFWNEPRHPLGRGWILSPEDFHSGSLFLGYSVQKRCMAQPFVPHEKRERKALMLAKRLSYFFLPTYPWEAVDFTQQPPNLVGGAPVQFISAAQNDSSWGTASMPPDPRFPNGVVSIVGESALSSDEWFRVLASLRVLVGIGIPYLSPSPWDALCLGVPFINVVNVWDKRQPENRTKWYTQHDGLKYEEEPRVYHVLFVEDPKERARMFWEAIGKAVTARIDRYLPTTKTPEAVTARLAAILDTDWQGKAEALKKQQKSKGKPMTRVTSQS